VVRRASALTGNLSINTLSHAYVVVASTGDARGRQAPSEARHQSGAGPAAQCVLFGACRNHCDSDWMIDLYRCAALGLGFVGKRLHPQYSALSL
jgi:hypothetical protein